MVQYECEICKKIFTHKGGYNRHKNRKNPCTPHKSTTIYGNKNKKSNGGAKNGNEELSQKLSLVIPSYPKSKIKCEFCNKEFTYMSNLSRHKKNSCKGIVNYEKKIKTLENYEKNEDYGSSGSNIKIIQNNHTDTVNNITNNTVNNILNINQYGLNPYGKENMDYISQKDKMDFIKSPHTAIPKFIKAIHFNAEHPENHNVLISSIKNKLIKFYKEEERWEYHDLQGAIEKFTVEKYDQIHDLFLTMEQSLEEHIKDRFEDFAEWFDSEKSDLRKNTEYKTKLALISGTEWIKNKIPTKHQLNKENSKLKMENEKLKQLLDKKE